MNNKKIAKFAIDALKKEYKNAKCYLNYKNGVELLIASILSARCTDVRVNIVTSYLFKKFQNLESFCKANQKEIEDIIKTCGLYKNKTKNIILMSKILKEKFNGKIPDNIKDLIILPGIGRKIANLILGELFKKPAYIVDTHCFRITKKLGIQNENNPTKAEIILKKVIPSEESKDFCHRLVAHGKLVCTSKKPLCHKCIMKNFCLFLKK